MMGGGERISVRVMAGLAAAIAAAALLTAAPAGAQERVTGFDSENVCAFFPAAEFPAEVFRFASSEEAQELVREILGTVGLAPRFEVYAGSVPNAAATVENGARVIYYSEAWIQATIAQDRWQAAALLAHEIGHHLNAHTFGAGGGDRILNELEADRFAGFAVARLGGSVDDALRLYRQLPSRGSATHPPKAARLEAVAVGWRDGSLGAPRLPATPAAPLDKTTPTARAPDAAQATLQDAPAQDDAPAQNDPPADIAALQRELLRLGLYDGAVDGVLSAETEQALGAFADQSGALSAAPTAALLAALQAAPTPPLPPAPATFGAALRAAPGVARAECPACPPMLLIPGGTFTMGSPESEDGRSSAEGPQQPVTIAAFALGRTEVTQRAFAAFLAAEGRAPAASCWTWDAGDAERRAGASPLFPGFAQPADHPALCVNHQDALDYIAWLNAQEGVDGAPYRLPSEAEWEFAARAGADGAVPWAPAPGAICENANGADLALKRRVPEWTTADCDDGHDRTAPAASFAPNAFGLHDMLGNAWEWTADCWRAGLGPELAAGAAFTGGACSAGALRGGSWDDPPTTLRAAQRVGVDRAQRNYVSGFRVARTLRGE